MVLENVMFGMVFGFGGVDCVWVWVILECVGLGVWMDYFLW